MELSYWIYFKPGEKDKLKQIIDENPNPLMANIAIQEEFGVTAAVAAALP